MHSSQKFVIKNKNKKQPHIRFKYWYFKIYILKDYKYNSNGLMVDRKEITECKHYKEKTTNYNCKRYYVCYINSFSSRNHAFHSVKQIVI